MKVVIDASVVVKWLLPDPKAEPDVDSALTVLKQIRSGDLVSLQPPHWLAEAAAVVTRLHPKVARQSIGLLHAMELPVVEEIEIYMRAAAIAEELNHHVFDTLYHAVALERDATLITADEHYYRKAQGLGELMRLEAFGETRRRL